VRTALTDLSLVASGKVRELYRVDDDLVLVVASDRISAWDHVLPTPIPDKGRILTALTEWWADRLADVVPIHVVTADPADPRIPPEVSGRAMLCRRLDMYPVECVARGYLAGSALADYRAAGSVSGVPFPAGLVEGSLLPAPVFTPATKAARGDHDENISFDAVAKTVGADVAAELQRLTLALYARAELVARERGLLLADTKFEFGRDPASGELVLGDEMLTPDSSRYWPLTTWEPGGPQPSYDKQYVRDWLTSPASGWNRASSDPPPPLPDDVVDATRDRYVQAYERLTGRRWA
jgi:phosphoribosylaminoimidazole-succinocarboxamide synthase